MIKIAYCTKVLLSKYLNLTMLYHDLENTYFVFGLVMNIIKCLCVVIGGACTLTALKYLKNNNLYSYIQASSSIKTFRDAST